MVRFALAFLLILVCLFSLEMTTQVQEWLIEPFTGFLTTLSAALIKPFDSSVVAYGEILQFTDSGFAVSIEAGCNGVEATIVLIAAVVAFPAPWRARWAAMALGFLAVQIMNIARIISLFYLGNWNVEVFTLVHLYLWPVLIMLDVLVVFVVYLRYLNDDPKPAGITGA